MSSAALGTRSDRERESRPGGEASAGELFVQLSEQTSRLIRDELRLAQIELRESAKRAGRGGGLLGGAGAIALYALGALIATAIIALSLVLDLWAAALIVTVALFIVAGIAALLGKSQLQKAFPPTPQRTMQNLKRDVQEVKESRKHEHA